MYFRKTKTTLHSKIYCSYQLVKSVRTKKGPRQVVLANVQELRTSKENWKELAAYITYKLRGISPLPFTYSDNIIKEGDRIIKKIKAKKIKVDEKGKDLKLIKIREVETKDCKQIGPEYAAYNIYKKIGLEEIIANLEIKEKYKKLAAITIISRLVAPKSELGTTKWLSGSALPELVGCDREKINKDVLYRVSDKLLANKNYIEKEISQKEENLFNGRSDIILYDLSTTYFEGAARENKLAKYGHSKDGRGDCKQVLVGLILDNKGFPKAHKVYEGNKSESKTLVPIVKELEGMYHKKGKFVVVDRGMSNEKNLKELADNGYKYVVALRGDEREEYWAKYERNEYIEEKRVSELNLYRYEESEEAYLMYKSEARAEREKSIRKKFIGRIEEDIKKLEKQVQNKRIKDKNKILIRIGKIRQRNNRVAKFYKIEYKDNEIKLEKYEEKIKRAAELDGVYLLKTNEKEMELEEMLRIYRLLLRVEDGFKNLKSDLGIRPVYHHKGNRTEAHIFISVLGYHILNGIREKLRERKDKRRWSTIKEILRTQQLMKIIMPGAGREFQVRVVSRANKEQKEIYEKLGIEAEPLKKKIEVIEM